MIDYRPYPSISDEAYIRFLEARLYNAELKIKVLSRQSSIDFTKITDEALKEMLSTMEIDVERAMKNRL